MTSPREQRAKALNALAVVIQGIRPEWEAPGIVAALRKCPEDIALHQLVIAAARYADDNANATPAHIADIGNRAWDSDWYLDCKRHPGYRARRLDGECGACHADRVGTTDPQPLRRRGVAPTNDQRQQILASITGGSR